MLEDIVVFLTIIRIAHNFAIGEFEKVILRGYLPLLSTRTLVEILPIIVPFAT